MLSSPIPTDPTYGSSNGWSTCDSAPKPRVKPEAASIAEKHRGSVGLLFQLEGQGIYRPPRQRTVESRDYAKENVRKMRQMQSVNRRRKEEDERRYNEPVKVLPQSEKYRDVSSKLSGHLSQPPPAPRPGSANYLRAHSRVGTPEISIRGRSPSASNVQDRPMTSSTIQGRSTPSSRWSTRPSSSGSMRPSTVGSVTPSYEEPTVSEAEMRLRKRDNVNYVALNARQARYMHHRKSPSATSVDDYRRRQQDSFQNHRRGEVPTYLRTRQNQWDAEAEDRRLNAPDPDMPPGHTTMAQKDRLDTLDVLREKEKELINEIQKQPITSATLRARNKKAELEARLCEIEEAIKIFSRQKVYIKLDE